MDALPTLLPMLFVCGVVGAAVHVLKKKRNRYSKRTRTQSAASWMMAVCLAGLIVRQYRQLNEYHISVGSYEGIASAAQDAPTIPLAIPIQQQQEPPSIPISISTSTSAKATETESAKSNVMGFYNHDHSHSQNHTKSAVANTEELIARTKSILPPSQKLSFLSSMNLTREDFYERNYFHRAWMTIGETTIEAKNETSTSISLQHPLLPMKVMTRYISEHSHQQLELEWNEACGQQKQQPREGMSAQSSSSAAAACYLNGTNSQHRRYLVASYSCPIESGNRLHRFMNGLLWAVLTNRTFLWRYEDYDVCEEYGEALCSEEYNPTLFLGPGDCDGILERSPWIPSYQHWTERLGFASDHSDIVKARPIKFSKEDIVDSATLPFDGIYSGDGSDPSPASNNDDIRLIRPGRQGILNPTLILTKNKQTNHLTKAENLERLESIRSEGIYFVYGMLFESLFTLDPSLDPPYNLLPPIATTTATNTQGIASSPTIEDGSSHTKTIFIHSRHAGIMLPENINPERACFRKLMATMIANYTTTPQHQHQTLPHAPCHIYVMSDQPITVALLHQEIQNSTHCTSSSRGQTLPSPEINKNNNNTSPQLQTQEQEPQKKHRDSAKHNIGASPSFRIEHGPRAGRGYWEDLALVIRARDGMIAKNKFKRSENLVRTSTALIREIVEFRRVMERHHGDVFGTSPSTSTSTSTRTDEASKAKATDTEFFQCMNPMKDEIWLGQPLSDITSILKQESISRQKTKPKKDKKDKKKRK